MQKRYRLNITKSNQKFSGQIIDFDKSVALGKFNNKLKTNNIKGVSEYAKEFAGKLKDKKINSLYYDNKYKYHGKVKKFIEILRENKVNI